MGKQWKQCQTLFWGGSKITADGDCSHEIKRHLLLGRKAMTNLDSILTSRDITLLTKVRIVKALAFPVVMYGCESWTIKKAENWKIDAFELWCWRRLLRVPRTVRQSNLLLLLLLSCFSHVRLCATPDMAAYQALLSLGFSRQEHWSGLPFPSPMHESEKWKWSHSAVPDS